MMNRIAAVVLIWASAAFSAGTPALAATTTQNLTLQASLVPVGSMMTPYSGTLNLSINPQGAISGTYNSTSIRPDPSHGRTITVTGTLNGTVLHLRFGMGGGIQVDGTFANGKMKGVANNAAQQYNFKAYVEK